MFFIYSQLILVLRISCIENGAECTMRGIPDIEHNDKKKCLPRFHVELFQKYAPVQRFISPIPGILTTFFSNLLDGRFVTSTTSRGETQMKLSNRVSDSKPGNIGGFSTW